MTSHAGAVTIVLHTARLRHGLSAIIGVALGLVLVLKTAILGQIIGALLVAWGLYHAARWLVATNRGAATLAVRGDRVTLPRKAHKSIEAAIPTEQITAAYLLRHASPWHKAAPTLVIEAGREAFVYPRDWFASETDQRRIIDAIAVHKPMP